MWSPPWFLPGSEPHPTPVTCLPMQENLSSLEELWVPVGKRLSLGHFIQYFLTTCTDPPSLLQAFCWAANPGPTPRFPAWWREAPGPKEDESE